MCKNISAFFLIALPVLLARPVKWAAAAEANPPGYAIERVSVVDVEAGRLRPDCTVLIEGATIRKIGPGSEAVPEGFGRVAGEGLYLIPGLFDAHVHYVDPATYGPLFIAHGVTFVRDMGSDTDQILKTREQLNSGNMLGPEMICTGSIVDGKPPVWPFSEVCETPDEGRAAVRKLVEAGVNQIKVYSGLKPEVFLAVAEESKKRDIKFVGHVPELVTLEEAMNAGQYTCEHFTGFGVAIAKMAGEPVAQIENVMSSHIAGFRAWSLFPKLDRKVLDEFIRKIRESGMVQCPTLVVYEGISRITQPESKNDERLKYVPPHIMTFWESDIYRAFAAHAAKNRTFMQQMVAELHRVGVPLIVGSDLANPFVFAGSAVHEEIELFAQSGLSPAEALKAATIVPARVCGVAERLGTVAEGKTASLVLLRADPLDNASNVRKVESVFLRGRYFDRAHLDRLKAEVRESVGDTKPKSIDIKVEVPGEIVARGVYKMAFNRMDAGTEEFAIGKNADGYQFMSLSLPKGGWAVPNAVKLRYDAQFKPLSAEWHEFGNAKTMAKYSLKVAKVEASAIVNDKPAGDQSFDLPQGVYFGGPSIAGDYFLYNSFGLKPGDSREFSAVTFGFNGWKVQALKTTMKRLDDEDHSRKDGTVVRARRYSFVQEIPGMGPATVESWSDGRGVVLKYTLKFPFGTMTWELE